MRKLLLCYFLLISIVSKAQLSGNYTIGGTTSATNFATWNDFASALSSNGVSGSVAVKVISDLTVTAAIELKQNGSNPTTSTKKIAIDGNGKKLIGALTYEVLWMNGIDFVECSNLTVVNSGTATTGICVRLSNGADDNMFSGCSLEFSGLGSSTKPSAAYIAFASSQTNVLTTSSSNNGLRNTLKNCALFTSGSNSPGPMYAIVDQQGSSNYKTTATSNTISGNAIKNFFNTAIYVKFVNGESIVSNDISRSAVGSGAPLDTVMFGIQALSVAGSSASLQVSGNKIHDLPYLGAAANSTTNFISRFWGVLISDANGSSTYPILVSSNELKAVAALNNISGMEISKSSFLHLKKNSLFKLKASKSGQSWGANLQNCDELEITSNLIRGCVFGSTAGNVTLFNFSACGNSGYAWNRFEDNVLDSNTAGQAMTCLGVFDDGDWQINRNRIAYNVATSTTSTISVVLVSYLHNLFFASNLLANNEGYTSTDNFYCINYNSGYKSQVIQNTIYSRASASSSHFASAVLMFDESEITFTGNILDVRGDYYGYGVYIYSSTKLKELNNNTCYIYFASGEYWSDGVNFSTTWSDYKAAGVAGSGEYFGNPNWVDLAKYDFRSLVFENQNNVSNVAGNETDILGAKRALVNSDRGCTESYFDVSAVKTSFSIASQICSGYEGKLDITVKNNFTDTVYKFNVAYSLNGKITRQMVTNRILPKDSLKVNFTIPLKISAPGNAVIQIFVEAFDDNRKNDTITFKTFVKPAPGGGFFEFSTKTQAGNNPVYQRGKPIDVTVLNVPVIYDVNPPRSYTNAQYGFTTSSKWNASVLAVTASGRSITGSSLSAPTGTTHLEIQFKTSDATLEDSTITLLLKISDITNGCDTILKRQILIYPGVSVDFSLPKKFCVGDTLKFVNKSKYSSGYVENWWTYGTSDPKDTSNLVDGSFVYQKTGTYSVKLRGTTSPYGFVFEKIVKITVNPIPKATFTRENACFGEAIKFVNKTTPSTADMYWDFGDGNGFYLNNSTNISIKYKAVGSYVVHLTADIAGCQTTETQKATQFVLPKASFTNTAGRCEGDFFEFKNGSSISGGSVGSRWFFNSPDSISNELNPTYRFYKSGDKSIKLLVKSEFGCKDSQTRVVRVFESPKVAFAFDAACIRTATQFTNQTPAVFGAVSNYLWDFGDGNFSAASNPKNNWSSLGKKTVKLLVKVDNGCADSISKTLNVLMQPKADFNADPICSGDEMAFFNKSTTAAGVMSYSWDFGDNTTTTVENPKKRYSVKQTTAYNATLVVYLIDGCADSITKGVTVQELPRTCDFRGQADYDYSFYGLGLEPMDDASLVGGQSGIDYTWIVTGLGLKTSKDINAKVQYDLQQDGLYTVTMKSVVRATGCECSKTKQVVMDRAALNQSEIGRLQVFPNPVKDKLWVKIPTGYTPNKFVVWNAMGAKIMDGMIQNAGMFALDLPVLSPGIYTIALIGDQQFDKVKFIVAD